MTSYGQGGDGNPKNNDKWGPKLPEEHYTPGGEKIIPDSVDVNPSTWDLSGQEYIDSYRSQTEAIMRFFHAVLPDNYVSQVRGPFYTLQFQAAAEQIAKIQVNANEVFADADYDFTRPEFLYQILGNLVFPEGQTTGKIPDIPNDLALRDFLRRMVILLLRGARPDTIEQGIGLLTDAEIQIIEFSIAARHDPQSAYTLADQFGFEVSLSNMETTEDEDHSHVVDLSPQGEGETNNTIYPLDYPFHEHRVYGFEVYPAGDPSHTHTLLPKFPHEDSDPIRLWYNIQLALAALDPAHALIDFRYLFQDFFGVLFSDEMSWEMHSVYYDDFRKFCLGARELTGEGDTLEDRSLFRDADRSFKNIPIGAELILSSGPNTGRFQVEEVLAFILSEDTTSRAYTTSPTGLTGTLVVSDGDTATDASQDWALADEGEILTITDGPNSGDYRLDWLMGSDGGPVGFSPGPATQVRVSPSTVRLTQRMASVATAQPYKLTVDRLGVQVPRVVSGEDSTEQFWL